MVPIDRSARWRTILRRYSIPGGPGERAEADSRPEAEGESTREAEAGRLKSLLQKHDIGLRRPKS
jgi:hypothetical protein